MMKYLALMALLIALVLVLIAMTAGLVSCGVVICP